jgi:hypothetical protein
MPTTEGDNDYGHYDQVSDEAYLETVAVLVAPSAGKLSSDIIRKILNIEQQAEDHLETEPHTFLTDGHLRNMGRIAALRDVHSVLFQEAETRRQA